MNKTGLYLTALYSLADIWIAAQVLVFVKRGLAVIPKPATALLTSVVILVATTMPPILVFIVPTTALAT